MSDGYQVPFGTGEPGTLQPPLVAVLIPAFNASATLAETLNSLLSQTLRTWKCVVVDDGVGRPNGGGCPRLRRRRSTFQCHQSVNQTRVREPLVIVGSTKSQAPCRGYRCWMLMIVYCLTPWRFLWKQPPGDRTALALMVSRSGSARAANHSVSGPFPTTSGTASALDACDTGGSRRGSRRAPPVSSFSLGDADASDGESRCLDRRASVRRGSRDEPSAACRRPVGLRRSISHEVSHHCVKCDRPTGQPKPGVRRSMYTVSAISIWSITDQSPASPVVLAFYS